MPVAVKICGVSTPDAVAAAVAGGAAMVGFVFYPRSPRNVTPDQAASLAARLPPHVTAVGLVVDADDALIDAVRSRAHVGMIQAHGKEPPDRIAAIKARTGLPVMKAIAVAEAADLEDAARFLKVADRLLFDAKAPASLPNALPGGNGLAFDWPLLAGRSWPIPWMLSGGLSPDNMARAVAATGARAVDVSSGVESTPGRKDTALIARFLDTARSLG